MKPSLRSSDEPSEGAFRRFATAVTKYWVSKRAAAHAAEALECLGGNGFVEDSGMPLLYRDAPLNSIWEGSGNVAALDVMRAIVKEPEGLPAFLAWGAIHLAYLVGWGSRIGTLARWAWTLMARNRRERLISVVSLGGVGTVVREFEPDDDRHSLNGHHPGSEQSAGEGLRP